MYGSSRSGAHESSNTRLSGSARQYIIECCQGVRQSVKGFSCKYYVEQVPVGWTALVINGSVTTFAINEDGLIRNRLGKVTRGIPHNGYYEFQLDGRRHQVHNLVALTFLPAKPSSQHTIDHVNRNPGDNRLVNLRWATPQEQAMNRREPARASKVVEYKREEDTEWLLAESSAELVDLLCVTKLHIERCCQSEKSVKGYNLRYLAKQDIPGEIWKTVPVAEFQKFREECKAARVAHTEKLRVDRAERRAIREANAAKVRIDRMQLCAIREANAAKRQAKRENKVVARKRKRDETNEGTS